MKKILVVGSINMDLVTYVSRVPARGETIIGKEFLQVPGGKGANQGVAIAKLGGDINFLGRVGDDNIGASLLEAMESAGVDVEKIEKTTGTPTGIASITIDQNGDNSIIVVPGANFSLSERDVTKNIGLYERSSIVVHQLETPLNAIEASLKQAKSLEKTTILNPAPARELSDEIILNTDILIPNESELELLTGIKLTNRDDVKRACEKLLTKGVKKIIVTLGETGSFYIDSKESFTVGAMKVEAVDTTAAGDSFIGGLSYALATGTPIREAIEFASTVAALSVTKKGAQSSLPTLEEVQKFQRECE